MNHNDRKPKKTFFLYIVIVVLTLSLAALGVLSFVSLNQLATLQSKVKQLTAIVEEISSSSAALVQQSEKLDELMEQEAQKRAEAAASETTQPNQEEPQQEGMISPSSGTTFTENTDSSMDNLLAQIQAYNLPADNGTWSVYVCNLLKNSEGVINDTPMQAASLIKLFIMGAVYETYDQLSAQYGSDALDNNLTAMITVSDSDAANTLVSWLGGGDNATGMAKVNEFCKNHGYTSTSMGRMLLTGNENGDNYTSARDCGAFLKEIYQINNNTAQNPTLTNAEAMYYLLKMQQKRNKIPAQLPEGVHAANKTGELSNVENDAGIIFDTAKGIDLVVCYMSQDLSDTDAAQSTIAEGTRMIYGYYNE